MKQVLDYEVAPEDRVPTARKVCYSLGQIPDPLVTGTVGNFLVMFYNSVLNVPGKLVGTVLFFPRIWDAITDPWIGKVSDSSRSRFGRRRPFILLGGLATAATYVLLWAPPRFLSGDTAYTMYLLITGILFFTAYTVYKIPYDALGIELTPDYKERTALMAVRKVFHSGGEMLIQTMWLVATWWATALHKPDDMRVGMPATGILFAVFCSAMIVTAFVGTKERKATEVAAQMGFAESVKCTLQNRLFVRLVLSIFAIALAIMTLAAYVNYLFIYYLESPKLLAANGVYAGVMGIPFALLWWRIANRIGKPQAMLLSEGVLVLGSLATLLVFNKSFPYLVFVYGTIYAFGWAGVLVTGATIMADITDVDELETGQRREGSYGGVFGFIFKLGVAGSAPLMGYGIDLVGFVPELGANQSPETFLKLRLITALVSAIFAAVGMTFVWRFPLTPERALEVRRILEERRGKRGAIV